MPMRRTRTRASSRPSGAPTISARKKPVRNRSAESSSCLKKSPRDDQLPQPYQRLCERHHEGRAGAATGDLPERDAGKEAEPEREVAADGLCTSVTYFSGRQSSAMQTIPARAAVLVEPQLQLPRFHEGPMKSATFAATLR